MTSGVERELPSGTVTLLFSDVESSTKLLHELGAERYADVLAEHRHTVRDAFRRHGGVEVDTQGDALFVAFPTAAEALVAAGEAQEALAAAPIRVRMGLHTGTPHLTEEGYVGSDVHLGARIAAAGHGGQVLVSAASASLLGESDGLLLELGEHRLKDFDEPVSIFQLGQERFPPLLTISNTNLPRPASSFIGRERELGELRSLLQDGPRMLTLTGPGGSGKTRLALEAAAELVPEFKAGVFWVGLAALRDSALVSETIAQSIGAKDGLADHVGERELLLLLDNFEQVVEAAPELAVLVESCPNLHLLVTSRELLRVRGEVEYAVPPLADQEAVELFCARAQLEPDETVAELCLRLDNLPLAVELAAARTSALSPAQILERLAERLDLLKGGRDSEARQQTLRATIEWSYELLGPEEQRLFARLSVFRDGCTLEAAEEVCEADLDILQSLVDKSLLHHSDERFWMLETIREYATERLEESGEAEDLRRRHGDHYSGVAAASDAGRTDLTPWLQRVGLEHGNLSAALDWLGVSGERERELAMAVDLYRFWAISGLISEGSGRLRAALSHAPESSEALLTRALFVLADLVWRLGNLEEAAELFDKTLELARARGDQFQVAQVLNKLGTIAVLQDDYARSTALYEAAAERFRNLGDNRGLAHVHTNLGCIALDLGEYERAGPLLRESLDLNRQIDDRAGIASSVGDLGLLAVLQNEYEDAERLLRESFVLARELNWAELIEQCLDGLAAVAGVQGDSRQAARLLGFAERSREERGERRPFPHVQQIHDEAMSSARETLGEAKFAQFVAEGRASDLAEL